MITQWFTFFCILAFVSVVDCGSRMTKNLLEIRRMWQQYQNLSPRPNAERRLVNGEEVTEGEFPYQVALIYKKAVYCSGAILDSTTILTATHCLLVVMLKDDYGGITFVRSYVHAGSLSYADGTNQREVGTYIANKEFIAGLQEQGKALGDIALLKLKSELIFSNLIKAIRLPAKNPELGCVGVIAGWGTTSDRGLSPQSLQKIYLTVLGYESCDTYLIDLLDALTIPDRIKLDNESNFCAIQEGKDTCEGDSGGPFVINDTVYGVVSYGVGCTSQKSPTVLTNIFSHLDWIHYHWRNHESGKSGLFEA